MSCKECQKFQESNRSYYYRHKNANIEIRGCEKHVKELIEELNKIQEND